MGPDPQPMSRPLPPKARWRCFSILHETTTCTKYYPRESKENYKEEKEEKPFSLATHTTMNWTAKVRQYSSFAFFCQNSKRTILALNIGDTKPHVDDITCFHLDMDKFVQSLTTSSNSYDVVDVYGNSIHGKATWWCISNADFVIWFFFTIKKKVTPISGYRHECEFVRRMLIMVDHDVNYGVMPPLVGGLW